MLAISSLNASLAFTPGSRWTRDPQDLKMRPEDSYKVFEKSPLYSIVSRENGWVLLSLG
jgi:hypothetical protein